MLLKTFSVIFILFAVVGGCRKEERIDKSSCTSLLAALINNDTASLKNQIDGLTAELEPVENNYEPPDTRGRIDKLVGFLNGNCNIKAEVMCVECIYTNPPISEIRLQYVHEGRIEYTLIDLQTTDTGLRFTSMHD